MLYLDYFSSITIIKFFFRQVRLLLNHYAIYPTQYPPTPPPFFNSITLYPSSLTPY
jgi:hypothetical protein